MPKNKIKKVKKPKLTMVEINQISDVHERLDAAKKRQKEIQGKVITQAQLEREKKTPAPKIGGVKVRPKKEEPKKVEQKTNLGSTQNVENKTPGVQIKAKYKNAFGKQNLGSTQGSEESMASSKMTRQQVQETYFKPTLDPLREQLKVLVDKANKQYQMQRLQTGQSRAGLEAVRTLNKRGREHFESTFEPFNYDLHSKREINREFSRVMAFLGDYTASIEGGYAEREHGTGLFGAQWRKDGGPGYNEVLVDKEDALLTFDIYHRLLEQQGGWQRVMGYFRVANPGVIEYGSENLINMIYDMVLNKDEIVPIEGMSVEGTILNKAVDVVNQMIESYQSIAMLQRSSGDYGNYQTREEQKDAEERYNWQLYKAGLKKGK